MCKRKYNNINMYFYCNENFIKKHICIRIYICIQYFIDFASAILRNSNDE